MLIFTYLFNKRPRDLFIYDHDHYYLVLIGQCRCYIVSRKIIVV